MGPVSRVNDPTCHRDRRGRRFDWRELAVAVGAALGGAASWTSPARGGPARGRRSLVAPLERARQGLAAQGLGAAVPAGPSRRRSHRLRAAAAPHPCARSRSLAGLARRRFRCPCHRQSGEARTSPSTSAGGRSVIGWALPRRPRRPCSPPRREPEHRYCRRRRGKRRPLRSCSGSRGGKEHRRVAAAAE